MDVLLLAAPTGKVLRLRRIVIVNPGSATSAIVVDLQLAASNSAGSGGTDIGANVKAVDPAGRPAGVTGGPDAAFNSMSAYLARSGDTTQATVTSLLYSPLASISVPTVAGGFTPLTVYDARDLAFKPVTVVRPDLPSVVLRIPSVGAGATGFRGYAEFTVDDA
jgi:hypothetical protein